MKSAPLTSCQQAAEAFRVAMHNIGALKDVAFPLLTDDPQEEELAQWPDRASEEDHDRDLGMREWREGGDWRLVDGADGNYNPGLEQPAHDGSDNMEAGGSDGAAPEDSPIYNPDFRVPVDHGEQIPSGLEPEFDEHGGDDGDGDDGSDNDPTFVGAVAAKMVKGGLQLLIRWEAGDNVNHTRHPQLHCLTWVYTLGCR
jgi:hypothetical protein